MHILVCPLSSRSPIKSPHLNPSPPATTTGTLILYLSFYATDIRLPVNFFVHYYRFGKHISIDKDLQLSPSIEKHTKDRPRFLKHIVIKSHVEGLVCSFTETIRDYKYCGALSTDVNKSRNRATKTIQHNPDTCIHK